MLYTISDLEKEREGAQGYRLLIPSLTVCEGDLLAITGPSGCGKSTTLDMLGLALSPTRAGRFLFTPGGEEYDVPALFAAGRTEVLARLRLTHMGYVLQTGELIAAVPVRENMLVTARMAGLDRKEAEERAENLAKALGIAHKMEAMPGTLSVGERQRVAIVRALVPRPSILLADEPTAALDPMHAGRVMDAFLELCAGQKTTLILVTHDQQWVRMRGLREVRFSFRQEGALVSAILG